MKLCLLTARARPNGPFRSCARRPAASAARAMGAAIRPAVEADEDQEELLHAITERSTKSSWLKWCREGNADIVVPVILLGVASVGVLVYNIMRQQFEPCDTNQPLAKHFYCYNASAPPGVHDDR